MIGEIDFLRPRKGHRRDPAIPTENITDLRTDGYSDRIAIIISLLSTYVQMTSLSTSSFEKQSFWISLLYQPSLSSSLLHFPTSTKCPGMEATAKADLFQRIYSSLLFPKKSIYITSPRPRRRHLRGMHPLLPVEGERPVPRQHDRDALDQSQGVTVDGVGEIGGERLPAQGGGVLIIQIHTLPFSLYWGDRVRVFLLTRNTTSLLVSAPPTAITPGRPSHSISRQAWP